MDTLSISLIIEDIISKDLSDEDKLRVRYVEEGNCRLLALLLNLLLLFGNLFLRKVAF